MKKTLSLLFFIISITMFSQLKKEWGSKFDYDEKKETNPNVVLVDNYNHYMVSIINIDGGMMPTNQIIIRKFDQKNQLVNTFIEEFPHKNVFTLHNFLGSFELGTDKLAIFTDCYSNKTKKKEIHKIIFYKKKSTFTTTLVAEFTFESLSKSGDANIRSSQNKNYISIIYGKYNNKKIEENYECIVLDGKTSDLVWQKNISFPLQSYTENMILTNSGKIVFIRNSKETGSKNILAIADGNTIENKNIEENIQIYEPMAFSIGTQDYLIAFNNPIRTISINSGNFENILLYDLNSGKILKNNSLKIFNAIKDLQYVHFNTIFVQNNEIHLFVDCTFQTGTKPNPTFPNSTIKVPVYSNGNPSLLVFSMDGEFKNNIFLGSNPVDNNLIKSFGVLNIKGDYYINTGFYSGFDKLNAPNFTKTHKYNFDPDHLELDDYKYGIIINQFCNYLPDSKRALFAKSFDNGKIAFLSVLGLDL